MRPLLVCNILVAYLLGVIVTNESPRDYLLSQGPARFVVGNTLMRSVIELPGGFVRNAQATDNGSINTLPVEVKADVLLALLGLAVTSRRLFLRHLHLCLPGAADADLLVGG